MIKNVKNIKGVKPVKKLISVISGGKDGLFAYQSCLNDNFEVVGFLNLINNEGRVSFHAYGKELVKLQARSIGLPIMQKSVAHQRVDKELFEKQIFAIFSSLKKKGIDGVVFGYILSGDYQDKLLVDVTKKLNMELILPNYKKNSKNVLRAIIDSGLKIIITAVKPIYIGREWLGREVDNVFFEYLSKTNGIDYCGDKGEYHTLVVDAPFFKEKIVINKSEVVTSRQGYELNIIKARRVKK
ncbi:diphthine--ammonia ligase [Candidatus Parcubacteria bacterium]|nr:diphthine--ammonia ligase [Patescibacteria group bacterium]MBU4309577.1 diphthine--ammonia ligase [Patescibacteria group bacterium]MBU4432262.1 diphthine--ammonia ligase [Patescibacteria group bacterium]MBU4578035.1 diphthine--ammonia ligase [Patescibacteria group bacterium]MCG2696457.1 diphthine--ammonia ligase [Candidatus Parcubacteria bacterium]